MRSGSIALTAASALVALGGLYLLVEVRRGSADASPEPSRSPAPKAAAVAAVTKAPSIPKPESDPGGALPVLGRSDKGRGAMPEVGEAVKMLDTQPTLAKYDDPPPSPQGEDDRLEANKAYDRGDYESARALALKSLNETPKNVKLLRVVVSSSCIMGDADLAQQYAAQLPEGDRAQMAERCAKFQIALR